MSRDQRAEMKSPHNSGLALAAGVEFGVSSPADSEETFRHLFLFHALTDVTVCRRPVGNPSLSRIRTMVVRDGGGRPLPV